MERRFGERCEIVSGRDIVEWCGKMRNRGEWSSFSWIVSLESARHPDVNKVLSDMQPPIDVVVVDEAHRMRNLQTLQHRLGRTLSECAEAMVLLTATPVQTSLENLFRLLNILDSSEFQDHRLFEDQCRANQPVVRAAAAIRSSPPAVKTAIGALNELKKSPFTRELTKSDYFSDLLHRCQKTRNQDREALVALQQDILELSLTGKIISRTRKSEVMPNRSVRSATTVRFRLSPTEQRFYDLVGKHSQSVRPGHAGWGQVRAATQHFRAAASCIPAAAGKFQFGRAIIEGILSEFEDDDEGESALGEESFVRDSDDEKRIRDIEAAVEKLAEKDTKYEHLRKALNEIWDKDENSKSLPRKVVLFAFFKPTLGYLQKRLNDDGIASRLISGDIPIRDRGAIIEEFANDPNIRVLLSSEVGSEGIDLQFASTVVNYDLPWNPMVVEQRIGRIDRIGQASPRLVILNMVAEKTIEDRILNRLYERIGIFEQSIGEIEPILGKTVPVEELILKALRGELTPAEQEIQAEQSADAMKDQQLKAVELANNTDSLLAADQAFLDEIETLIGRRRIPSETELFEYISEFLKERFPGSRFPKGILDTVAEIRTPERVGRLVQDACAADPEGARFGRTLETGPAKMTFNQDAALKHANTELVHARHPIVRMVTNEMDKQGDVRARAFALMLNQSDLGDHPKRPEGEFAFEVHLFDVKGVRPRVSLLPIFIDDQFRLLDEHQAESLFLSMLSAAKPLEERLKMDPKRLADLSLALERALQTRRSETEKREDRLNFVRLERRRATISTSLDHRVNEAKRREQSLLDRQAPEFSIRMARAKLKRAERERESRLKDLDKSMANDLETERLAAGVLQISNVP